MTSTISPFHSNHLSSTITILARFFSLLGQCISISKFSTCQWHGCMLLNFQNTFIPWLRREHEGLEKCMLSIQEVQARVLQCVDIEHCQEQFPRIKPRIKFTKNAYEIKTTCIFHKTIKSSFVIKWKFVCIAFDCIF